jgi:hypothetical protein
MSSRAAWSTGDLDTIGAAGEIGIAPVRVGGSVGAFTTIWVVRVGDDIYVRSYRGAAGRWYHDARHTREGGVRVAGVERAVTFHDGDHTDPAAIDAAYRAKYGRSHSTSKRSSPSRSSSLIHGMGSSRGAIDAGKVFDLPALDQAAEGSLAMDERRAIKTLVTL